MFTFSNKAAADLADLIDYAYTLNSSATPGTYPLTLPKPVPAGYKIAAVAYATDNIIIYENTRYYAVVAESADALVVAIRGTGDAVEWVLDFDFTLTPFSQGEGKVETGFYSIFLSMRFIDLNGNPFDLTTWLVSKLAANPQLALIVEGHSLGGALSSMLAVWLSGNAVLRKAMNAITIASPAPGDGDFAAYYNGRIPATYRIWNPLDLVPHAPPESLGFVQLAGIGLRLAPTWQQMEQYDFLSPLCNHSLLTYQWLLDTGGHPLTECQWPLEGGVGARLRAAVDRVRGRAEKRGVGYGG
ncbi:MAG: lipase family protein [Bryobacterales bacterium]|nr:lipase family protein [Bryobacterales bacterium]